MFVFAIGVVLHMTDIYGLNLEPYLEQTYGIPLDNVLSLLLLYRFSQPKYGMILS